MTDAPAARSWQPGDEPGRPPVRPADRSRRRRAPAGVRRHPARGDRRLRDVGDPGRGAVERRARPPRPHRRQPCGRAGRPRSPDAGMVGPADRSGRGRRHRPVVRGVPQRARGLPGDDRSVVGRTRRCPVGITVPEADHPGPGRRRGRSSPTTSASTAGPVWSAGRWAACGCSSGASATRTGWSGRRCWPSGHRPPPSEIALCSIQCRAIRLDPDFSGGDYYGTGPAPRRPAWRLARGIGQISYRTEAEFDRRFGRRPQGEEDPSSGGRFAVESYLGLPGREARAPVRPQLVRGAERGHEQPRRRPGTGRRRPPRWPG